MITDADPDEFEPRNMLNTFSTPEQYNVYSIPKKSGGRRMIEAPNDELKEQQRASLVRMQRVYMNPAAAKAAFAQHAADMAEATGNARQTAAQRLRDAMRGNRAVLQISHFAHAFAHQRNIVSGAAPHVGAEVILTADLSDFFPSIKFIHFDPDYRSHQDLEWRSKSYAYPMQYVFGCKKVAPDKAFIQLYNQLILPELKMHFCDFGDGKGLRLPQGSPASPFLSNVLLCRLDYRAAWRGYSDQVQYTRYADDLIFSGADEQAVKRVYAHVVGMLAPLRLRVNPRKYQLRRGNQRKQVLGLAANALPADHPLYGTPTAALPRITRYTKKRIRSMKHHCRVIHTLETLGRERGFQVDGVRPYLLSKTEGMSFRDKVTKVVTSLQATGAVIDMQDLQNSNLLDPPRWYSRKIAGHIAFEHMVANPPENAQDSLSYCACQQVMAMM